MLAAVYSYMLAAVHLCMLAAEGHLHARFRASGHTYMHNHTNTRMRRKQVSAQPSRWAFRPNRRAAQPACGTQGTQDNQHAHALAVCGTPRCLACPLYPQHAPHVFHELAASTLCGCIRCVGRCFS